MGSVLAFSTLMAGIMVNHSVPGLVAGIVGILIGGLIGGLNGVLIAGLTFRHSL